MNFLESCQKARQEAKISGNGPSTVKSQTGMYAKLVEWVNDEWYALQSRRDNWYFQRASKNFQTIASVHEYPATSLSITDLGTWNEKSFKQYLTADGLANEYRIGRMDYADWDRVYNVGVLASGVPQAVCVSPDNALIMTPVPNDVYTVTGIYYRSPTKLVENSDVPRMPERFHDLLWMGAVLRYLADQEAPIQRIALLQDRYNSLLFDLEREQLPTIKMGRGAFA